MFMMDRMFINEQCLESGRLSWEFHDAASHDENWWSYILWWGF